MKFTKQTIYLPRKNNTLFILDPGHGGMVDGVYDTYPSKMYDHKEFIFFEGVFNRQVVLKVMKLFRENNCNYALSTNLNLDVSLSLRTTRANNIKKLYPDMDLIFLSFHGNAAGVESASGIELFTSPGLTKADPLAAIHFEELSKMGWKMRRGKAGPDKEARFHVLTNTKMPAILFELGFFTNKKQALQMMDPEIQKKLATHILNASKRII